MLRRVINDGVERTAYPFFESYAKAWCNVVQKYPRLVGIPVYGKAFVSSVCPALGYPDPPYGTPPRYPQGQCPGIQYDIFLNIRRQFNDDPPVTYTSPRLRVYGPITDIGIRQNPDIQTSFLEGYVLGKDEVGGEFITTTPVGGVGFTGQLIYANIFRTDGLPVEIDCYDPNEDLPEDPPIDPSDFNPVVPFPRTDPDGNDTDPWYIPVQINLNPDVDFNLDFDIGGDKYDIDYEGFQRRDAPPVLTPVPKPTPVDEDVVEKDPVTTTPEEDIEQEIEEGEKLEWVLVDVVMPPRSGKTITYKDAADITYFAGYLNWLVDGNESYMLPEIPIRKAKNAFSAPDGVKGYRIISVNGAILVARAYVQQLENS